MNQMTAAPVSDMTKTMFMISGAVGMVLGIVAFSAMFGSFAVDEISRSGLWAWISGGIWLWVLIAALSGIAMGVLCCSAMYVAIEIHAVKCASDTSATQSVAAGFGAVVAGVLPALLIVGQGISAQDPWPTTLIALGFLLVCFAVGFVIVAGLNLNHSRGLRA
ncbi:hypothetical protein NMP99_05835 [Glutamicibacter mishrai]|uniref:hypothetical protein n=1 Tax=Glutamicibacter mishrai TaxID=1775880 RepID=UPI0020CE2761|nr:hypothetical protein [Glutamicibacter mishrai]UTT40801.1 hypothetical protein NMP99_05835 [Glutamicibacter mishrai]